MEVTKDIDVAQNYLKLIIDLLHSHLPNTTVWAFGSRVKFTSSPESDLDLIAFIQPHQQSKLAELKEIFAESNLPFRVDIFDWNVLPDSFKKNIQTSYFELIKGKEKK